ncbi:hypothetical protein G7Z17_g2740 [Cylindrodendrum hubeiense]|uniref:Uncharacterized protein n=1 Tax=Cylindrodendrum hubeiense TaxID=595255 RepID=A0A9P5HIA2_9HYPO|nr:hypothetical protein G7Z17_g2740 [Cylindrodendrum hubeiense]
MATAESIMNVVVSEPFIPPAQQQYPQQIHSINVRHHRPATCLSDLATASSLGPSILGPAHPSPTPSSPTPSSPTPQTVVTLAKPGSDSSGTTQRARSPAQR